MVICETVTIDGDNSWLVQYEDTPQDQQARTDTLTYLRDCGHEVTTEPHPVVGPSDEPAVSWGDLSDRDD